MCLYNTHYLSVVCLGAPCSSIFGLASAILLSLNGRQLVQYLKEREREKEKERDKPEEGPHTARLTC